MNSCGNPQSIQSTLIPLQNDPSSKLTGNISEGNVQKTAIDSTLSPSIPLYAFPDKLTRQKVINSENVLQMATNNITTPCIVILKHTSYLTPIDLPCIVNSYLSTCQLKNGPSSTSKEKESNDQHGKQHEEVSEIIEFTLTVIYFEIYNHYVMSSSVIQKYSFNQN